MMPFRAFAVLAFLLTGNFAAAQTTWGQWQGDAAHTGTVAQSVNSVTITPSWSVTAASLGATSLVVGAVTDSNHVYFTANMGAVTGNTQYTNYNIFARNLTTGSADWSYQRTTWNTSASAPSVAGNMVYANYGGHSGISGGNSTQYPYLVGVIAGNGSESFATNYAAQFGYANQPTVSGTSVYSHAGYFGGMRGVNGATGSILWTNTGLPQQTSFIPAADATNIYFYMGSASASPGPMVPTFYAMNKATGAISYTIQNPAGGGPLGGNVVNVALGTLNDAFVATSGSAGQSQVVSFNLNTQSINWSSPIIASGAMAVNAGKLYVPIGDRIRILDEATGAGLGSYVVGNGVNLTGNVLVTNNLVFVTSATNTYAFDKTTMNQVWTTNHGGIVSWGGNTLIVSNSGEVVAFATTPIPEPAGLLVLVSVGAAVLRYRRKRKTTMASKFAEQLTSRP